MYKQVINFVAGAVLFMSALASQAQQHLTLEECRAQAVSYNKDLKAATINIEKAEAQLKLAKKAYLPKIDASASGTYIPNLNIEANIPNAILGIPEEGATSFTQKTLSMINADVALSVPVYLGGKIRSINKQAEIGEAISKEQYQLTYADIVQKTDQAYWSLSAAHEGVKLAETFLKMLSELEEQMNDMYEVGLVPASEKLKVSVQKNQAELELLRAGNGVKIATIYLNQLIGLPLEEITMPSQKLEESVFMETSDAVSLGIGNRKELSILQKSIEIKNLDTKIARSSYLPQIGVQASYMYMYAADIGEDLDPIAMLAGSISIPVFHWGEKRQKLKIATHDAQLAQNKFDHTKEMISLEITQVTLELDEAFRAVQIAKRSMQQAEESLSETKVSFEAQLNTTSELLSSQADWQNANFQFISALVTYEVKKTAWLKATGQLTL